MSDKKQLREFIKSEINSDEQLDESLWSGLKKMFSALTPQAKKQFAMVFDNQRDFSKFRNTLEKVVQAVGDKMTLTDFLNNIKSVDSAQLPNNFWSGDYDENELEDMFRQRRGSGRRKR